MDVVRVDAVTFVTTATICCDNNVTFFLMGVRRTLDILLSNVFFLPRRLLQARARQKECTNVRIFGSVES